MGKFKDITFIPGAPRWVYRSDPAQAYSELPKVLNNWLL